MKVLCYGNQGNTCFRIARWLREYGIDTHLYIPANRSHSRSLPEWEDPSLKNNYPDWIHTQPRHFFHKFFPEKNVRKNIHNFDVVLSAGDLIISALSLNTPVVFVPAGGDINGLPFITGYTRQALTAALYRSRIHRLKYVITAQDNCYWSAKLWGVENVYPISLPVDTENLNNNIDQKFYKELINKYSQYDAIFFHPTRKNMHKNKRGYKAPEKVLYAYRNFLNQNLKNNIKTILVSVCHGHHVEEYKDLVHELNLQENVSFEEHLPLPKLHAYMNLPNVVVFDKFKDEIKTVLGGICREALSLGCLHITCVQHQDTLFERAYGTSDVPFFYANTEDKIFETMQRILGMPVEEKEKIKDKTKKWAYEKLDYHNQLHRIIEVLKIASSDCS